jgi:signal transduction histidine kinase
MLTTVVVLSLFAIAIVLAFAVLWQQRQAADDLAAQNAEEAAKNAERAAEVDALHSVAHDLDNIFGTLIGNASTAYDMTPTEVAEVFASVEAASRSGRRMIRALRGTVGAPTEQSLETALRLVANTHRRCGTNIEINVASDLKFIGQPEQAFRIVYNLLANAAREVSAIEGATIRASLTSTELRISNPLRPGAVISERIYERGFSGYRSSGLGLQIVREVAAEIELHVGHEVRDGEITFIVSAEPVSATHARNAREASGRLRTGT